MRLLLCAPAETGEWCKCNVVCTFNQKCRAMVLLKLTGIARSKSDDNTMKANQNECRKLSSKVELAVLSIKT